MNDHHEDGDDGSNANHDHDGSRMMMMSTMVVMIVTHDRCIDMMIDIISCSYFFLLLGWVIQYYYEYTYIPFLCI